MTQRYKLSGDRACNATGMASFDFAFYHSNNDKGNEILVCQ
jgi:hypothetical protein